MATDYYLPNTAFIMNQIVQQLSNVQTTEDIFAALCEFAMGAHKTDHTLDVCFGFNQIYPMQSTEDIVLGQGIYRVNSGNIPSVYPPDITSNPYRIYRSNGVYYSDIYMTEFPIDINEKLEGYILQNTYAFGSIYFSNTSDPKLGLSLLTGNTGELYMLTKDLTENEIIDLIFYNQLPENSSLPAGSVEIFKIIVDIEYFSGIINDTSNRFSVIFVDKRKSRGWAGFAEQNFISKLAPVLLRYKNNTLNSIESNSSNNSVVDTIADLVDEWKNLSWPGGFDAFWNDPLSTYRLPDDLYFYIYGSYPA